MRLSSSDRSLRPSALLLFVASTIAFPDHLINDPVANPIAPRSATITAPPSPSLVAERLSPENAPPKGREACSALLSVYGWCSSSGYSNLSGTSALASCACYYNKTWVPKVFDGIATSCYNYIRSVQPEAVTAIDQYLNVCFTAGDISKSLSSGSKACNTVAAILTSCGTQSNTQFSGVASLANCACYSKEPKSLVYNPNYFDGLVDGCYNYAQDLDGQGGQISTLVNFCNSVGDVRYTSSVGKRECEAFNRQYSYCDKHYTGDWEKLNARQQASCLCYDANRGWIPDEIDSVANGCVGYLKTTNPEKATEVASYTGFCGDVGDVRGIATTTTARPGSSTAVLAPTTTADAITPEPTGYNSTIYSPSTVLEPTDLYTNTSLIPPTPTGDSAGSGLISTLSMLTMLASTLITATLLL